MTVQRDWGDRANRKHARLKYTIEDRGLDAFRAEVERRVGVDARASRGRIAFTSTGDRYGWTEGDDGNGHLTLFVENGRVQRRRAGAQHAHRPAQDRRDRTRATFASPPNQNVIIANVAGRAPGRDRGASSRQHGLLHAVVGPAAQLDGLRGAADLRAGAGRERALPARPDRRARRAARDARALPTTTSSSA